MACIGFAQSAAKLGKLQHGSLSRKQALNLRLASIRCEAPQSNGNKPSSHAASTSERSRSANWDRKSDIYVLRSDGYSCNRETVTASGNLEFSHPSSQQHLLVWKARPKRVLVLKKLGDELLEEYLAMVQHLGADQNLSVLVEPAQYAELKEQGVIEKMPYIDTWGDDDDAFELHSFVDFVVCLGGDGLVLHATHLFGRCIPPIIAFRLGSLGFLTPHEYEVHMEHLDAVINGSDELTTCRMTSSMDESPLMGVYITLRMRLQCEIHRNGQPLPGACHHVLNEVVLSRGSLPYLSKIEVYERDHLITKVQADGVMLSTPTGSTAYSVSAGGSMVHPNVHSMLFTPICPHSLSFRPIILPDYAQLQLRIAGDARSGAVATFDGKNMKELLPGDSLHVRMSPFPVPTINFRDQTLDWFSSIERCFMWNERTEQKEFQLRSGKSAAKVLARLEKEREDSKAAKRKNTKAARAAKTASSVA